MPRNRWTPERDAPLLDAVFNPAFESGFSEMTQVQIRDVRAIYVEGLGWSRERLSKFRFRILAASARRAPEIATVQLRPPAQVVTTVEEGLLEQQLAHMSSLPFQKAKAHFESFFLSTPEVLDIMDQYRIRLSRSDYEKMKELAAMLGVPMSKSDAREGNDGLSAALSKVIEVAYDRLS